MQGIGFKRRETLTDKIHQGAASAAKTQAQSTHHHPHNEDLCKLHTFLHQSLFPFHDLTTSQTLSSFFDHLTTNTLFGQTFALPESPTETTFLNYIPLLSGISIEFKHLLNVLRREFTCTNYQEQQLPTEALEGLSKEERGLLGVKLGQVDVNKTFFSVLWSYMYNPKQRIRDYRAPSILCYYRFAEDKPGFLMCRLIGLQFDSLTLLYEWNATSSLVLPTYNDLNKRLKDFIEIDREEQTVRQLKGKKGEAYPYYMHQDFYNLTQKFYDVKD
ncbi:hypothetical protein FGO68_gene1821 [Halteria grandinella]|uniref:Uncharacterized protein n=1 Tax=Halteria grandinella TaxID=5974 RepID=A0A8J8NYW8_HALGN|nr:hypothetical protein FGO68_gene1821 [Halteria grandinella]